MTLSVKGLALAATVATAALAAPAVVTASVPPTHQCNDKTATVLVTTDQGPAWTSPGVVVDDSPDGLVYVYGTDGDDVIVGTDGRDGVIGDAGQSATLGGNDTICT